MVIFVLFCLSVLLSKKSKLYINVLFSMKLTRAFICVEFSDGVIREVARVQELLDKKFIGKFTELENLHLTLKFLGEIDEDRIVEVKKRLGEIKLKEFEGKLHSLGTFSHKGN